MDTRELLFYGFGPFRLDIRQRLLLHEGVIVPLTPRVFDTLLILVESNGHVLEKEVLIRKLWPDSYVEESSLAQNISLLRKALGEDTSKQYILTFPKRGYLFTADIEEIYDDETEQLSEELSEDMETDVAKNEPAHRAVTASPTFPPADKAQVLRRLGWKSYVLICCTVVVVASAAFIYFRRSASKMNPSCDLPPKSIAILPFNTVGAQSEAKLLGFGMADTLIIKMSSLQGLSVLPTNSVSKYTEREKSTVEIGRELGVDVILDGTVQRSNELVRVSAQLIRVNDGTTLWSAKFDEKFSNIFEIHDLVAEQMAQVLTQHLTANDHARLLQRYTKDPDAYEAYLTGVYFWSKRTKAGLIKAIYYFRQAIKEDPLYALAYAMLSDCYNLSHVYAYGIVPEELARAGQVDAARKAMELDASLAEAHLAMAAVKDDQGEYQEEDREYRYVLELNPSHAVAHLRYSFFLLSSLELDKSLRHMRRARELDPVSPTTNDALGFMLILSRQYDEAIKYCRRALELDPEVVNGHLNLGTAYVQKEMYSEAIAEFRKLPKERQLVALETIAYTQARAGRRSTAIKIVSELRSSPDAEKISDYNLILTLTALGNKDKAFAQLHKLHLTRFIIAMLKFDPQLDPLRSDTRFTSYLQSKNLVHLIGEW